MPLLVKAEIKILNLNQTIHISSKIIVFLFLSSCIYLNNESIYYMIFKKLEDNTTHKFKIYF